MKLEKIDKHIVKVIVSEKDYNLEDFHDNSNFLESQNIITFSDTNFKVFERFFKKNKSVPEAIDLCLEDDKSIGLETPKTWYLNRGKHALSIAAYYNYLNLNEILEKKGGLENFNKKLAGQYGRVACMEIYLEKDLKPFLDLHKIKYFGTPRTLTECVRYLEGWDINEYPRLKEYATFSKFIELWSRNNFPDFNQKEWYLGKEESDQLKKTGKRTNVRVAIQYFWQNYLLKKHRYLCDEDVEVDILGGKKFSYVRQPKIILVSEDPLLKEKSTFPLRNAEIARNIYPDSLIVLIENQKNIGKNFLLINPIKYSINTDVIIATKVLRYVLETQR